MLMRTEMFKELNLTDEQKSKIEAVQKEYAPKTKELREKMDSILTEDQKKARKEAIEAAKTADEKRGEAYESIRAAVKLTDEQKAKRGEVMKEMERLHRGAPREGRGHLDARAEGKDAEGSFRPPRARGARSPRASSDRPQGSVAQSEGNLTPGPISLARSAPGRFVDVGAVAEGDWLRRLDKYVDANAASGDGACPLLRRTVGVPRKKGDRHRGNDASANMESVCDTEPVPLFPLT